MAKQLNVNLAFTADTSQAKAQLQSLQTSLTQLISSAQLQDQGLGISKELQHSITLSSQLKSLLANATNMETGKLDLGKFNEGLQKSGTSLQTYSNALNSLGVQGQQAFSQLASSILQAELPLKRSNVLLGQFMTTLKNTARWQISSSLLHGFIGTVKSAYGYAQDLNESLNNIRIVTGQNIDQMAKFAEKANQAAKALSTSTTEYTNASLIYYQQGLSDSEVQERTDVTIKMANVSRQSAEIVSDQMTAVWNNFYDGGKSLEYYADVMTALGAATASSSDEIAGGLEKFAAIGETIGLSYEYAASALATITANTRQSEEVVGTALKTIFARIQGLKLGETLEDGVELNKYSEALQTVGISIFEQNGELKKMDNILNEMGAKWDTLSKAQQTALAQTVAGVRQYNQLISLMDNWDDMQKNLDISYNAEGALQEQADTYAESWEAASKRVKASAEGIYQTLLNDKFFIGVNNAFAELLQLIDNTIDSFGGLPGVLFMLGSVITSVFGTQITQSFDNFIYRIKMSTEVGKQSILQLRQQANDLLITNNVDMASTSGNAAANAYRQQGIVQNELIAKAEQLSEIERQQAQYLLDGHSSLVQQTVDLGILVEQEERRAIQIERSVMASARSVASQTFQGQADEINRVNQAAIDAKNQLKNLEEAYYQLSTIPTFENVEQIDTNSMQRLLNIIKELEQEYGDLNLKINDTKWGKSFGTGTAGVFRELKQSIADGSLNAEKFNLIMDKLATSSHTKLRRLTQAFIDCGMSEEEATREAQRLATQYETLGDRTAELTESQIRLNNATKNLQNFLGGMKNNIQSFGAGITSAINVLSSFGMMMMSIKGIVDTLNNTEMSFGDKFFAVFTQMTFLLPSVMHSVTQLTTLLGPSGFIGAMIQSNAVLTQTTASYGAATMAVISHQVVKNAEKMSIDKEYASRMILWVAQKLNKSEEEAETIIKAILTKQTVAKNAATAKEIALEIAKKAIKAATNPIMLATVAITAALTAAIWAFVYASQAEERALQAAKESVDNTARAYEDAENAVTKFKETASNYTEAIKGMKDLAYGTAEYAEKLREANDAAIELIKNNPELKYDIQGGLIQFEGGMNALESLEKQLMNRTYNAKMFNINAEIEYENLLKPGKIESELEKLDVLKNEWIDIPALRGMGNEFIKKLGSVNEAEKQGILNSDEAIKNILKDSGWEAPGYSNNIDEFVKRINNLTPAEKQDLINLSTEINKNTMALQAETAAILQEEYGQENIDQYGEAEVYATKSAILDERASTAWTHEDHQNEKVGFAEYLDDDLNWGNNISNLSKENQELLAKVMGKSVEDIVNGEIRISDDKVEVSTGKDASNTMLSSMSVEDFNKAALNAAGQATVTWEEISKKLDTEEGRLEAQQYAKDSGLYSADDLTIYDEASSFKGLTYGTAKALETKFTDEDGEVSSALNEYFDGLDNTVKKRAAERLLQLDTTNLNAEQLDSTVKEITEKEAQQYREQQAKTELQTDSAKYKLDYSTTEKQMGRVKETLQDYNKELEKNGKLGEKVEKEGNQLAKGYGNLEKSSKDLTVANQRMNRGIATLGDNFEDWSKVLKTGDKTTLEYTEAMEGMKEAFADIYNISDSSLISDDFIENMDPAIMQQIADGNIEAIEKMRRAMADDIVANIILNNELTSAEGDTVTSLWQQAKAELDAMGDLTVGTHIEGTSEFITRLNELIKASGMTKDQVNSLLGSMGMSATLHTKYEPTEMQVPTYTEVVEPGSPVQIATGKDADGNPTFAEVQGYKRYTVPGEPITVQGFAEVVSIETESDGTSSGGGIDIIGSGKPSPSNTGRASGSGGGGGGGGGSNKAKKPTQAKTVEKTDPKEKDDEIERYKEITEVLDDLNNELDEIGKLKDEAWGPNKIAAMDQEIAKLKQLSKAQQEYSDEIQSKLVGDKAAVEALGGTFDEFGRLTNYEELMGGLVDTWNSTQASLDSREQVYENSVANVANTEYAEGQESQQWAAEDANDAEKEAIGQAREDADKAYEDGKKAIEQYIETLNLSEEAQRQLDDYLRQIKELNYEKLMYKVEFKVEVNDRELKILDHYIGRIEDDFYKTAEVMAKIQEKSKFYESGDQGILDDLEMQLSDLETAFKNGEITQADYIDGLGQIQDMALDNVDALYEMNNAMREYYSDVIDEGISKIEEMTSHFENLTSKLQHYSSILNLIGKEQDYDLQNSLLQGRIDVLNNSNQVSKELISTYEERLEAAKISYANATTDEDKELYMGHIKQWNEALTQEQDKYLSNLEEIGDAANQILTNSIEQAYKNAEKAMTNGLGFEAILTDMERLDTLSDEYLTNTNKMYETNKLLSQAQLAIDKTSNQQAKQKYQTYMDYVEQLQISGNMSKTDLAIAQARYKLLEAEIALEEAKNAKSEVRLTRDSEGNFGYVYTANQDEVASATQNYLDAQNELYNVGLETTKNYREKTIQLQQSTLEELQQLEIDFKINHIISEEQYNQQKASILETSNALLESYNQQFTQGQYLLATESYSALMEQDRNFFNGQVSDNAEHHTLMAINDAEYYNGVKLEATNTQQTLEGNLDSFNAGVLSKTDIQYAELLKKDDTYYDGLTRKVSGTRDDITGIFYTDSDSLFHNINTAEDEIYTATETWQSNMSGLVDALGLSLDDDDGDGLKQKIADVTEESKTLRDYITKKPDGLIDGIDKEWHEVEKATIKWTEHWQNIMNNVVPAYDELIERTQTLIQAEAGPIANQPEYPEDPNANSGGGGSGSGYRGGSSSSNGGANAVEAQAGTLASQAMEIVQKVHNGTIKQDSSGWRNNAKAAGYSNDAVTLALKAFNDSKAGGGYSYYYDKALELVQSYDTGGYTGNWGPEGKLALLHQKELVLNAQDTENFLTATSMLREISQMLDNSALLASLGMINLSAMTINSEADKILQQEVTIHADFPNVTDHNEIEMAIDNLINAASQYANRK